MYHACYNDTELLEIPVEVKDKIENMLCLFHYFDCFNIISAKLKALFEDINKTHFLEKQLSFLMLHRTGIIAVVVKNLIIFS